MGSTISHHLDGTGSQLVKAVKNGDANLVTELISAHPSLMKYVNMRQYTPLHFAATTDHTEVLQQLFSKAEELEFMQQLSERGRVGGPTPPGLVLQLANAYTDRGVTPLMFAAERGCYVSVKLLLAKGANPWAIDKLGGRTALHYAARTDNVEVMEALITAAGSGLGPVKFPNRPNTRYVDVRTQSGFSALHFAVHARCQQSLAVLLNAGANPMLSSLFDCLDCINCPRGSTALHLAARSGNMDASKQLLKAFMEQWHHRHMPDPRFIMDGEDHLPCQVAAKRQHTALARMLLPTTPLAAIFAEGGVLVLGPPTLAQIAGDALRQSMQQELHSIQHTLKQLPAQQTTVAMPAAAAAAQQVQSNQLAQDCNRCCGDAILKECNGLQATSATAAATATPPAAATSPAAAAPEAMDNAAGAMVCRPNSISGCSSCGSEELCGVCFEAAPLVALQPCKHQLCFSCCTRLLQMNARCVLICPFCRAGVGNLSAAAAVAVL